MAGPYNIYLFDDCCHIFISEDSGATWLEGCTPGKAATPAPNDPGLDPNGFGTIRDAWIDGQMAINDGDYLSFAGVDQFYNSDVGVGYGIIGVSLDGGRNGTWELIDPEPFTPAFISDPDSSQEYTMAAISDGADTILLGIVFAYDDLGSDWYPRISRDGGATWANVTGVDPNVAWSGCCFGSTASQVMYLQPSSNLFSHGINPAYIRRSEDWGVTWSTLTNGPDTQEHSGDASFRIRCSADGETVIRMERDGQFWISQDGGDNWTNIDFATVFSFVSGTRHADCSVTPDGSTIIVSTEQVLNGAKWPAVFVSVDGGNNFTDVTANLQYPASVGAPAGGAPGTNPTGCSQCNVAPDGLGMIVTFAGYNDASGTTFPDGLAGQTLYCNLSTDAGQTWTLHSFDADPYEAGSTLGLFTGIYITPFTAGGGGGGGGPPTITYPDTPSTTEDEDTVEELPAAEALIVMQRWLFRTAHLRKLGEVSVDDLRVTIKRGVGDSDFEPKIWVRVNRDNKGFGKWAKRGLGKKGDRFMTLYFGGFGTARDWQFEVATTDECDIELRKLEILPTKLGH